MFPQKDRQIPQGMNYIADIPSFYTLPINLKVLKEFKLMLIVPEDFLLLHNGITVRRTGGLTDRQKGRKKYRKTEREAERQVDIHPSKQTERQKERQKDRKTEG